MKKLPVLICALAICATIVSCRFHNNTSISYSENGHYYKMKAKFSRSKTGAVERYMDDMLASGTMSFAIPVLMASWLSMTTRHSI